MFGTGPDPYKNYYFSESYYLEQRVRLDRKIKELNQEGKTMDQITDQMKQAQEHEAQVLAAAPVDGTEVVTQGPEDVGEDTPVVI